MHSVSKKMAKTLSVALLSFAVLISAAIAGCPEIVPRSGWGARPARSRSQMDPGGVAHVFVHHTAGATCRDGSSCAKVARQIQKFHMDTNSKWTADSEWADIGYSFLVGGDGRVYEGRGWKGVGAHTVNYNSKSIGISLMGNFDKVLPSSAMLKATTDLIQCGEQKGYIAKGRQIHGHRDAKCTACPGAALYKHIQGWTGFKGGKLPGYTC